MNFSESFAWLQPKSGLKPVPLSIGGNAAQNAFDALKKGLTRIWGEIPKSDNFNLSLNISADLLHEEYWLKPCEKGFEILGGNSTGVLYGVYRLINLLSLGKSFAEIDERSAPKVLYRVINHWDNMDGSVERGYAGKSIFFKNNNFDYSEERIRQYAEMLASVGINAIVINNVNVTRVSAKLLANPLLCEAAKLAEIFRQYGIRMCFSVSFDSPVIVGGLKTPDPLDPDVKTWWRNAVKDVYEKIPDFLGFVVKADSEFRDGPAAFGRTQADGANTIAESLQPFGGVVFWRCFIYNCKQDWRDAKTDRPKAAYDTFMPLDGKFADNVILQIKFGPVDFQVREPISPLFSGLEQTKECIEYQITQEYTGHQIDLYGASVQWEEINNSAVKDNRKISDMFGEEIVAACAVPNIGDDENFTGHFLAGCNLYAFGRMAWTPTISAFEVTREWTELTFDADDETKRVILDMLINSRGIYENYTSPFGIGFMVKPHLHYGPDIEGYEFAKWGTYHKANREAIGIDRTSAGTGYTTQYPAEIRKMYDNIKTCPEELLLFFHRVRYDYVMKNGKTLLQNIYDKHFEGYEGAEKLLADWHGLMGKIPDEVFCSVEKRLILQKENAMEWRDQINTYFYRFTGIGDEKGRKIYD